MTDRDESMSERDEDDPLHQLDKAIGRMESETDAILDAIREDFTPPSKRKARKVDADAFRRSVVDDNDDNSDRDPSHAKPFIGDDSEDWDDEMRDEIKRLVSVTEALRQDLDSQNVESMNTALSEDENTPTNGLSVPETTSKATTSSSSSSSSRGMGESLVITSMTIVVWAIVVRLFLHVSYGEMDAKGHLLPPTMLRWILNH